jgi:hypothetical protein
MHLPKVAAYRTMQHAMSKRRAARCTCNWAKKKDRPREQAAHADHESRLASLHFRLRFERITQCARRFVESFGRESAEELHRGCKVGVS